MIFKICCIYQCKDTNFKANHNARYWLSFLGYVVFTNAKILILKLITTNHTPLLFTFGCIYQCKDTNFKANHNLYACSSVCSWVVFTNAKILILKLITTEQEVRSIKNGCIYQCKDTNFKANHNNEDDLHKAMAVVFTNAKILILKLITTDCWPSRFGKSCIYQCKDTNFKANHNFVSSNILFIFVVFTNAKILILKLITTFDWK